MIATITKGLILTVAGLGLIGLVVLIVVGVKLFQDRRDK